MDDVSAAPVLSTPDHVLEEIQAPAKVPKHRVYSDEELDTIYEVQRTVAKIKQSGWKRVALQFPDEMLQDAPRLFERLEIALAHFDDSEAAKDPKESTEVPSELQTAESTRDSETVKLFILADTSYGACCVDEVAAEHVDADAVVHYGRTCLSPTSRLPVLHIYTQRPLDSEKALAVFRAAYPEKDAKIVLMADVTYDSHVERIAHTLREEGYENVFPTSIINDPSSLLPNRTVPKEVEADSVALRNYHLFHISDPPASLLLTLSSRLASVRIFDPETPTDRSGAATSELASTSKALQRRYGLVTRLATASIFGILINTLSVKNYLHMAEKVKSQIAEAGKKSYTFIVGKLNAAKVANFSEVEGWVVIGCWESSLIDSKDFWRPVITPYELFLALQSDEDRVWTGEWNSDFQAVLNKKTEARATPYKSAEEAQLGPTKSGSEEDSAPPEFDLRTGRYVSHTRPMRAQKASRGIGENGATSSLTVRSKGELATIGGQVSPAAEYLRSQRTWRGLGSDLEIAYEEEGAKMEQGRSGIARGYKVNEDPDKH